MTSPADSQDFLSEALEFPFEVGGLPEFTDELLFIQDSVGNYLSFHWQRAFQYNITPEQVIGASGKGSFDPIDPVPYNQHRQRVLTCLTPERFSCCFRCGDYTIALDLVMSPVLVPDRAPSSVVVAGQVMAHPVVNASAPSLETPTIYPSFFPNSDRYHKLLTQIAWNIRRTLDLSTIWQQTVNGLGQALGVSRCIICPYNHATPIVQVVAEYCREPVGSLLGHEFHVTEDPSLRDAIASLAPIVHQPAHSNQSNLNVQQCSTLVLATCYQDQPNGLIILYQCDRPRQWCNAELDLMRELADQIGTAIAHATLFADSQALAVELQRVNSNLLQKHRDLEEASRQAEEASRLKSEFLANTSHELRTPLNGMIGFLKLIMDGMADDPVEQSEFIYEAYRSALHLLNIINDVLDIAKIEAGKLQIELSPVKLGELLSDVEDFTRGQVQQKNLSFEIQNPPTDDEIILFGNYQRLLQVMLNLVGNAIKFTHEGGITISVEIIKKKVTVQAQELPGLVKVRVADTGIGVSLDKQDKLFQSFSQVDGSRTRQYGGTGLGLAISQKLVEAMGGVVNFYSMGEGLGSTVTFTVPLYQDPVMITSKATDAIDLLI
jgi:signal transduction histidine kinase